MVKEGENVVIVVNNQSQPIATTGRVERMSPLAVVLPSNETSSQIRMSEPVSLIYRGDDGLTHYEAPVSRIMRFGLNILIELGKAQWVPLDRRRAERYPVRFNAELSSVSESGGQSQIQGYEAEVSDISTYGCKLHSDTLALEKGSLVAIRIFGEGLEDEIKALGILTRNEQGDAGIEFFDFSSSSRFVLSKLIKSLKEAA